jgi:outer membrane protein OmpA-like peptidoglycan-associated protein
MNKRIVLASAACALLLGACASSDQVKEAANAKVTGSAFSQSLHKEYVDLAKAELAEGDRGDASHFALKAKEAAAGKSVSPDDFKIRTISGSAGKTLKGERTRLISALGGSEAKRKPAVAAKAQGMFDCWMQEQEEGWQSKDIKACRTGYEKAMALLTPKKKKKKKKASSKSPYTVYFKFDSADLTPKSEGAFNNLVQDVQKFKPKSVHVIAYTDLSGNADYNAKLAEKRAAEIQKKLKGAGAKNVTVEAKGAVDPIVDTGKPNQPNRRAIVVFKKK